MYNHHHHHLFKSIYSLWRGITDCSSFHVAIAFLHLCLFPQSLLFNPIFLHCPSTILFHVSFESLLPLLPSTSKFHALFTPSPSSFLRTCPYHLKQLRLTTVTMVSNTNKLFLVHQPDITINHTICRCGVVR